MQTVRVRHASIDWATGVAIKTATVRLDGKNYPAVIVRWDMPGIPLDCLMANYNLIFRVPAWTDRKPQ